MKYLYFVTVNYFSSKKIKRLLNSMPKNLGWIRGIIVDNSNSSEEFNKLCLLKNEFDFVECIRAPSNVGFSRGTNIGIKHCLSNAESILILNPDTVLAPGFFETLGSFIAIANDCAVSPRGLLLDSGKPWSEGGKFFWLRARADVISDSRKTGETEFGTCACLLVPKLAIDEVGLLDEDFFLGGEEWDYSLRLRRAGWSILYIPSLTYYHEVSGTHEKIGKKFFYIGMRTKILFARKHYGPFFLPWLLIIFIPMSAAVIFMNARRGHGPALQLAPLLFIALWKSMLGKRISEDEVAGFDY